MLGYFNYNLISTVFKEKYCFCHSALDAESISRGVLQYAPTRIDSRFRGNDISETGMTLAKPKLHYHNSFLLVDIARTPF
jgi:hypothetical protein